MNLCHKPIVLLACFLPVCAATAAQQALPDPFVHLLDTGAPLPKRLPEALDATAWKQIPEGTLEHAFAGDVAFHNNHLMLLLRRQGAAGLYARSPKGWTLRASLAPADVTGKVRSLRVVENQASVVAAEATYSVRHTQTATVRLGLTTAAHSLTITGGEGMQALLLGARFRHVVIPEFFGDDLIHNMVAMPDGRTGLPVENSLLGLVGDGDAMLMCLWSHYGRTADLMKRSPVAGTDTACAVACPEGDRLWVAVLEHDRIWHAMAFTGEGARPFRLGWSPPFDAKWHARFVRPDATTIRWNLGGAPPAAIRTLPLVVYPLDRTGDTPLTVFCPIDIMRRTLGIGACQYILDAEGFGKTASATPDAVTRWVEKQFRRNRAARKAAEIKMRLDAMVEHVHTARKRIDAYAGFAREARRQFLADERQGAEAALARHVGGLIDALDTILEDGRKAAGAIRPAGTLANAIVALAGKPNALDACTALAERLRELGAIQDRTIANCRLTLRRIRVLCRTTVLEQPETVAFAKAIREHVESMLLKE